MSRVTLGLTTKHHWPFLTELENQIAYLVCEGMTNVRISEELVMPLTTLRNHLRTIYTKLGVPISNDYDPRVVAVVCLLYHKHCPQAARETLAAQLVKHAGKHGQVHEKRIEPKGESYV